MLLLRYYKKDFEVLLYFVALLQQNQKMQYLRIKIIIYMILTITLLNFGGSKYSSITITKGVAGGERAKEAMTPPERSEK